MSGTPEVPLCAGKELTPSLGCRLKIENGGSSSAACKPEAEAEDMRVDSTGKQNGGLREDVPTAELKALRNVGFETDSTRHVISHADLQ